MEKRYQDLYWGARYHLKRDGFGQYYLIGMQQKIWQVFGLLACVPMIASLVMALATWLRKDTIPYFYLIAASFLFLLVIFLLKRSERFVFQHDRVTHLLGWGKSPAEKASWPMHECDLTIMPIVEHGTGCWLRLNANGQSRTRNSIGKFDQSAEMALFIVQETGITAYDNVTKWPAKVRLESRVTGEARVVKPQRAEGNQFQVQGSIWRMLLVFPATLGVSVLLFALHWLGGK